MARMGGEQGWVRCSEVLEECGFLEASTRFILVPGPPMWWCVFRKLKAWLGRELTSEAQPGITGHDKVAG